MSRWEEKLNDQLNELADLKHLDSSTLDCLKDIHERHPMRITRYYYDLIDWSDPQDPLRKLAVPSIEEAIESGFYDTSAEEENTMLRGLQHKYQTTALILSTNTCFLYCRHCFRKRMVGYSLDEIQMTLDESVHYVKNHPEINNVLISGGDSFTLNNESIKHYLKRFSAIKHLQFIRFGTRVPVVFPERIHEDPDLIRMLAYYGKKKEIVIVTHFNHAREITHSSIHAIQALKKAGCQIKNQTVLLKGVNDNKDALATLLNQLTAIGVQPYYVFQCRPVKRGMHFQVPLSQGGRIIHEAKKELNGISKSFRYVMSHARGKIEIIGTFEDNMVFKFHQAKDSDDHDRIFQKKIEENHTWLDQELNPF